MSPRPLLALVLLVGCEPPVETPKSNEAPVAAITSHADGDTVDEGYVVSFRGTITDADHGPEDLVATWFAGDEELCAEAPVSATGESTCDAVLGVDEGAIQLLGRDPEGATGVAELSLVVNATDAPVAEILSPTTTGRYYAGLALPVEATIADAEDDADSLTVIWTDETGAELTIDSTPEGGVLQGEMAFDAGDHALTLTVTDLTGKVGVTSVDFVVGAENTAPSCTITSPLDGGDAEVGTYVDLTATVGDLDQPVTELVATWSSDLDGPLGGTAIGADGTIAHGLDTLTFGTHVLTLTVVDELGAVCTDDLLFSIGTPPDATIEAPLDAELYNEGDLISFLATVSDSGTSPDALALTWESDRDGLLDAAPADSTGLAAFDADWLSAGEHVVTLNVTDVEGLYAEAAVTFTVNGLPTAPALGISPASPFTTDALVAAITVDAIDPEGDSLSYTWAWTRDGAATAYVTDTVPADATTRGEVWEVIATPNDGWGAGAPGSTSVVIGNSAPVLTNAVLSPDPAWAGDTLSCTPDAATDADGDTVSYTYAWMVDGVSIGSTASSLDDSSWSAGDAVVCVVTPTDGTDAGVSVPSNTVTIDNSTPAITSVSISPVPAAADDTLTCSASGFTDPDGDLDQTTFAWTVNGAAAGAGVTLSGAFVGGDTVVCTATPFDGTTSGTALSATLTVENTPPVLASVSLTPATPTVADTLTCAPGVTTDIDGTTSFTWRYTWTIDGGAIAATTSTLTSADFDHGDVVACSVTPNDGTEDGAAMASSAVTIQNTAPVLASVTLSPDPAWEGDTLSCSPDTATDADGDSVSYAYAWTIDGAAIGATSSTLGDTSWSAGNVVACVVTPTDGFDAGSPVTSNSVTIDNSTPTIASVAISPASPAADDTLTCAASGFSDRDGDADRTTYAWTLNGAAAGTGSTLLVAAYGGDTVVCTATPFDGTTSGTALTDTVTLENTPPVLASVSLTPTSPTEADTLTCAPGVTTDIDGTTSFSYAYAWTVDGGTISATASTLSPTEFDRGDVIRCRITPNDGTEDGASLTSSAVTIQNTAPGVVSVTLSPSAPDTDDTVTASATGTDLDGDTVTFTYAWYVDGTVVAATGATLSGTYFARDEEVYVVATPTDGTTSGTAMASASVTVANTAPSISAATITPDPATVSSTLTCAASGFSDLDGDPNATTYAWTVDGAAAGTGATLTSGFGSGDVVVCTATPSDGTDTGTARTDSITIANTAPVLASVSLTPTTAYEASTLTCAPGSTTDADGTTSFTYTYAWYVNSALVAPVTTTLTGAYFGRGDSVSCRVTPNDGASSGSAVSSSAVTIGNTAPVLATVTLNSYAPTTNATLTASVTSSDADSDTVTYTYAWYVNGSAVAVIGPTLSGATYFDRDDTVYVRVTPTDGTTSGTAMSSSTATVANTAPTLTSAAITPTTAYADDTLTCTASGYSDADGDPSASTYAWTVNGTAAGTGSTLSSGFTRGSVVVCTVTPNDGTTAGTAVVSPSLTIANTAPVLASVTLTPTTASAASTLTCAPGTTTDADGTTSFTYTYAWYVNSALIAPVTTTLTGTYFGRGDSVSCRVTPNDGASSGSAVSSGTVTIGNTAPVLATVTLNSYAPTTNATLTASVTSSDADSDTVTYTYAWYVNGSVVASTSASLSGATYFDRDDTVYVRVTPTDGTTSGTAMSSSTATVANTAPTLTSVAISPTTAYTGNTLTCTPSGGADVDGDSLSYGYAWTVNGTAAGTSSTLSSGFSRGSVVVCTVTPNDGTTAGTAVASSSLTIANTAPVLASVTLTPTTASATSTMTCSPGTTTDADGTTSFTYAYRWTVNGSAATGSSSTLSGAFVGGNTVRCYATPNDGTGSGAEVASSIVTIGNTAPVLASVTLTPTTASAASTMSCAPGATSDADGTTSFTYAYRWTVNGSAVTGTTSTLAGAFAGGNTVRCYATPNDGTSAGAEVGSDTVTIGNSTPVLASVSLTPTTAYEASTLTCAPGSTTDADGTTSFSYTYAWYVNGSAISATSTTLTGTSFSRGNTVYCRATPSDGVGAGSAVSSSTVTISNSAPTLATVTLDSYAPTTNATLTASATSTDSDSDTVTYTYAWYVNGSLIAPTTSTLSGATYFGRGDTVYVRVTPTDGTTAGTAMSSSTATVANTVPVLSAVSVTPTTAYEASTLTCTPTASDADSDTITYAYAWYVNSSVIAPTTSTLTGTYFGSGNTVYCRVTPSDSTGAGTAVSASTVTIANTAPVLSSVTLTPTTAYEASTLTCAPTATDADGTTPTYTYNWYVNSALIAPVTSTLTGTYFSKGNTVYCRVTPSDGTTSGTAVSSTTVTISNTAPVMSSVTLSPTLVYTNDTITTSVASTDADGDTVSYSYAWYVNGSLIAPTSSSLSGATYFSKTNTVYVRVTPTDGTTSGTASTSSTVTIGNSTPVAPVVAITPEDPEAALDPLVCSISTAASDVDGDSLTYSFTWTKNGSSYTGDTDTSTTSTVPASATAATNIFVCQVTASDGSATSSTATDTLTVLGASYTLGNTTDYPSTGNNATNYLFAQSVTISSAVQLYEMGQQYDIVGTGTEVKFALYTNSAGAPGTLVAYTAAGTPTSTGTFEIEIVGAPVSVAAGTYWMVWSHGTANGRTSYASSGYATNVTYYKARSFTTAFPSSFGSASSLTGQAYNLYAVVR